MPAAAARTVRLALSIGSGGGVEAHVDLLEGGGSAAADAVVRFVFGRRSDGQAGDRIEGRPGGREEEKEEEDEEERGKGETESNGVQLPISTTLKRHAFAMDSPSSAQLHEVLQRTKLAAVELLERTHVSTADSGSNSGSTSDPYAAQSPRAPAAALFFVSAFSGTTDDGDLRLMPLQSTGDLFDLLKEAREEQMRAQQQSSSPTAATGGSSEIIISANTATAESSVMSASLQVFVRDEVSAVLALFDDAHDRATAASDLKIARSESTRWRDDAAMLQRRIDELEAALMTAHHCTDCEGLRRAAMTHRLALEESNVSLRRTQEERDQALLRAERAERERDSTLEEIEELTRSLFEEANRMVSDERRSNIGSTVAKLESAEDASGTPTTTAEENRSPYMNLRRLRSRVLQLTQDDSARTFDDLTESTFRTDSRGHVLHDGVRCDGCAALPIVGTRYKCINCEDVDFCAVCERKLSTFHDPTHILIQLPVPPGGGRKIAGKVGIPSGLPLLRSLGGVSHRTVQCAVCSQCPISGTRYHCYHCSIDACDGCVRGLMWPSVAVGAGALATPAISNSAERQVPPRHNVMRHAWLVVTEALVPGELLPKAKGGASFARVDFNRFCERDCGDGGDPGRRRRATNNSAIIAPTSASESIRLEAISFKPPSDAESLSPEAYASLLSFVDSFNRMVKTDDENSRVAALEMACSSAIKFSAEGFAVTASDAAAAPAFQAAFGTTRKALFDYCSRAVGVWKVPKDAVFLPRRAERDFGTVAELRASVDVSQTTKGLGLLFRLMFICRSLFLQLRRSRAAAQGSSRAAFAKTAVARLSQLSADAQMEEAVRIFDFEPSAGEVVFRLAFQGGTTHSADSFVGAFADLLARNEGIKGSKLGLYFTRHASGTGADVAKEFFFRKFDFAGLPVLTAFRRMFQVVSIALAGDSQHIERIVQLFATRWFDCNSSESMAPWTCADDVGSVCLAMLFLNTSLHVAAQDASTLFNVRTSKLKSMISSDGPVKRSVWIVSVLEALNVASPTDRFSAVERELGVMYDDILDCPLANLMLSDDECGSISVSHAPLFSRQDILTLAAVNLADDLGDNRPNLADDAVPIEEDVWNMIQRSSRSYFERIQSLMTGRHVSRRESLEIWCSALQLNALVAEDAISFAAEINDSECKNTVGVFPRSFNPLQEPGTRMSAGAIVLWSVGSSMLYDHLVATFDRPSVENISSADTARETPIDSEAGISLLLSTRPALDAIYALYFKSTHAYTPVPDGLSSASYYTPPLPQRAVLLSQVVSWFVQEHEDRVSATVDAALRRETWNPHSSSSAGSASAEEFVVSVQELVMALFRQFSSPDIASLTEAGAGSLTGETATQRTEFDFLVATVVHSICRSVARFTEGVLASVGCSAEDIIPLRRASLPSGRLERLKSAALRRGNESTATSSPSTISSGTILAVPLGERLPAAVSTPCLRQSLTSLLTRVRSLEHARDSVLGQLRRALIMKASFGSAGAAARVAPKLPPKSKKTLSLEDKREIRAHHVSVRVSFAQAEWDALFRSGDDAVEDGLKTLVEYIGAKCVFHDVRGIVDILYIPSPSVSEKPAGIVETLRSQNENSPGGSLSALHHAQGKTLGTGSARARDLLQALQPLIQPLVSDSDLSMSQANRTAILSAILRNAVAALEIALLFGGGSRTFDPRPASRDILVVRQDLDFVKEFAEHVFGLDAKTTSLTYLRLASFVSEFLSCPTPTLISHFGQAPPYADTAALSQWNILAILCHRSATDKAAAAFVKAQRNTALYSSLDAGNIAAATQLAPSNT